MKLKINSGAPRKPTNESDNGPSPFVSDANGFQAAVISADFRQLEWNEVVARGDFVEDEAVGLKPWEGPAGFRANAFLKPIYRNRKNGRRSNVVST